MDRGGMTRKRIYLWMAAVLATVLLIVVLWGVVFLPRPIPLEPTLLAAKTDSATAHSQNRPQPHRHYTQSHSTPQYTPPLQHTYQPESQPAERYHKSMFLTIELNRADSTDLVQLYNVGPTFARRIMRYRNLLGGFVDKSQLWEVYGMDSVRYNDIAPHVLIDTTAVAHLDLNTATLDQLKRHPYLDYHQARAIVQARETMGLYHTVHDLLQVSLMDEKTYRKLIPYLTCNSQPSK